MSKAVIYRASILRMAEARAQPHIDEARKALWLADQFTLRCDFKRAEHWHRIKREKEADAENVKDLVMRAYA